MALMLPPLSLYLHFPWCVQKCPYCDFNSHTLKDELPEQRYVDVLIRDFEAQAADARGRKLHSIFMGGGTPSLFSPEAIGRVLSSAQTAFGFDGDIEVTMEANPGTIERGVFSEYRSAGVNRVSLGAQSFDAKRLKTLGRIHSPDETRRAAEELHASGLVNFNLDLMYGLPEQDVDGAVSDLQSALALNPAHLSHYQLTIEAGTVFAAQTPELPSDDIAAEMLAACQQRFTDAGFSQYEISAYAREGRRSAHNVNYWLFGDYVGAGAGAHGKLSCPQEGTIVRTTQRREPRRYLASRPQDITRKPVEREELPFEFMLNALRLLEGFEPNVFESRTGLPWATVASQMEVLRSKGLVANVGGRWKTTVRGSQFLNDVLLHFLSPRSIEAS